MDIQILKYDNFLIVSDFNSETLENVVNIFCDMYLMHNMVTDPTSYKNPNKPSCIDLVSTISENLADKFI